MLGFEVLKTDPTSRARRGRLTTPHGEIETPVFMPVGTRAAVKGITPDQVVATGTRIILGNTYHLQLRPGAELIEELGGLHRFMGWSGPMLTDSGGYQVFSLSELVEIDDDGVSFRSPVDGARMRLTPESATAIQNRLGADIIMCFDQCPPHPCEREAIEVAVDRSVRWAWRCKEAHGRPEEQWLFGINQGGVHADLRRMCAERLAEVDLPGCAIGGLSVGESHEEMMEVVEDLCPRLPADRPRYLMGVGMPRDIVAAVLRGVDMFDCVLPTRNGRNAYAFTATGPVRLRNHQYLRDEAPLEAGCDCMTCVGHSRAYLRHLFMTGEMLGPILVSIHNLRFYQRLTARLRDLIEAGCAARIMDEFPVAAAREDTDEESHS
ncbi:MAG: tRNA guanosine(34) transglycosylase Tgt [Phycisphaerae bacterium]|nr:tRNA guanosine(34) transglycosylase Tgt [Phycisphaerae bacterium]